MIGITNHNAIEIRPSSGSILIGADEVGRNHRV